MPAVMVVVAALTGGALLRVAVRVSLGRGRPAPEDPHSAGTDGEDPDEGAEPVASTAVLVWGPALALVVASLVWGVVPGVVGAAGRGAGRVVGAAADAHAGLRGRAPPPGASPPHGPRRTGWL